VVTNWAAKGSAWLLFATVAGAPVPFGSSDPVVIACWCIVLGLALILAPVNALKSSHIALLALGAVVAAAYGFVLHEQVASYPWLAIATPHPIWSEAHAALGQPVEASVSIARYTPYYALGTPLVALLSLATGLVVGTDRLHARQLLSVVAWSGACLAIFGIVQQVTDPDMILWREKRAYLGVLTSTFINRNTAAVYFGSCSVIWLLLLSARFRSFMADGAVGWREAADQFLSAPPRAIFVPLTMLVTCLCAMFMTGSRAGVILSLLALIVAFNLYFRRRLAAGGRSLMAFFGSGLAALILLQLLGEGVIDRLDARGATDEGRLATYRAILRMIAEHPWLGTGQGTFAVAYPAYRSSEVSMWGVWDIAHNTLLEIAADMGVPIAALVALGWGAIFVTLTYGVRHRNRDLIVPISALVVAMLAILHSLVDFSLQIPGYGIVAMALIGTGLAQSFSSRSRRAAGQPAAAEGAAAEEPQIVADST
jgi:hypothetical protein